MFSKIGVLKTLVLGSLSGEGFANFLQNFRTATIEIFFRGGGIEERGGGSRRGGGERKRKEEKDAQIPGFTFSSAYVIY